MLPDGKTSRYDGISGESSENDLAYSYWVDPLYIFYGLEWVLALTFLLVLALAVFTAHVQARSVRRERAFTRAAAHELKTPPGCPAHPRGGFEGGHFPGKAGSLFGCDFG